MIRDHEDRRLVVAPGEKLPDLLVDVDIVIPDGMLVFRAGFVFGMLRIVKLPECMMDSIDAHLHHHEKIPLLFSRRCRATLNRFSVIS